MKLEQSFEVRAPLEHVWEALIDVQRVAPCLPGAEIAEADEDGGYRGSFQVKLGPTTAAYRGTLRMESTDPAAHVATMSASGQDKRGQGGAKATIVSTMHEAGEATRVEVVTDFTITGRLARFGRAGMMQDISNRLLREFAECLTARLEEAEPAAATAAATPGAPKSADAPAGSTPPPGRAAPPPPAARPVGGLGLFFGALMDRMRRWWAQRRGS